MQKTNLLTKIMYTSLFMFFIAGCASGPEVKKSKKGDYKVEVVEAEGLAPLSQDIALARKNAVSDAHKRAIESVVGVYVSADSLVSKAQVVEDNITSQTEGFIEDYKIISENKDENFYKVKIKAWVKSEDLTKKLSQMDLSPQKYGNPRIAFWIDEKIDSQSSGTNIAELELMNLFVSTGYVVSDQKPKEYYNNSSALMADNIDNLQRLNSDIVVIGESGATFNTDQGLGGLVSYRANISLKILMTSTRDIITTTNDVASGIDINKTASAKKALEVVAKKSGAKLPEQVLKYLKERAFPTIVIKNISDLSQVKRIIRSIKTFPTVKDCWIKNFSQTTAMLSIDLKKGTLDEAGKMLELNDNFKFKVNNAGKYEMEVEIVREVK